MNAANAGDTIHLASGIVDLEGDTDGHIDIRKDLTIVGAGQDETFIFADDPTAKCMIGVVGTATVTFKDFTLDGSDNGPNEGVNVFAGITFIENSKGVIENMSIRNIGEDSAGGGAGRGIFLLDSSNVTVRNTDFSGNERDDVLVRGASTVIIENSTFTAKTVEVVNSVEVADPSREYGVRARDTGTVYVSNSTFTGYSTDTEEPSAAIRGQDSTKLFISDSTFLNNSNAILAGVALTDTVTLDLAGAINVESNVTGAVAVRGQGDGAFTGADQIAGTHQSVIFMGGAGNNNIRGGAGDDLLAGGGGNDWLAGGFGDDWLDGGIGADTMAGGADNDTYVVDNVGDKVTEASGQGIDTVQSSVSFSLLGQEIENLTLTGTAHIRATGNEFVNTLTGNTGNNVLDGAAGADRMFGGAGNDTYYVDDTFDFVNETSGGGTDIVNAKVTYTLTDHVENLTLTGGAAVNGTGNNLANTITGNAASNGLDGGIGNDKLCGLGGADLLTGGTGADAFRFLNLSDSTSGASGRDRIADFRHGECDLIDVSALDANSRAGGNQSFSFIGTKNFTGTAGQLRYSSDGTDTFVYADVNGDRAADFGVTLTGKQGLVGGDFIL